MQLSDIIILALIAESLWETLKMVWQDGKVSIDKIGAMIVGILIAIGSGIDILQLLGLSMRIPYFGVILTGLLISRGSNFMHDILTSIYNVHVNTKQNSGVKESSQQKAITK